jgi:hypothetical protein
LKNEALGPGKCVAHQQPLLLIIIGMLLRVLSSLLLLSRYPHPFPIGLAIKVLKP